jgi:hypothetical protein
VAVCAVHGGDPMTRDVVGALTSFFWGGIAIAGIINQVWLLVVIAGALSALALIRFILALQRGRSSL